MGMSATTGKPLDGLAHLRQRLADVLTTPRGTRVQRREYGSDLPELVDRPVTPGWFVEVYAAVAAAVARPINGLDDLHLSRVRVASVRAEGTVVLDIEGEWAPAGGNVLMEGIQL